MYDIDKKSGFCIGDWNKYPLSSGIEAENRVKKVLRRNPGSVRIEEKGNVGDGKDGARKPDRG